MNRDELVERVAEAMSVDQHARHHLRPVEWADHTNIWRDECRARARAALAIIEPVIRADERDAMAQRAFDQMSDDPAPCGWNDACIHIAAAIRAGAKP